MDDWFTIVLFFLFFVLPLLEGLLKKKKGPRQNPMPPGARRETIPGPQGVEVDRSLPAGRSTGSTGNSSWSDDWGSWPGEELEDEDQGEPVPSWSAPDSRDRYRAGSTVSEFPPTPPEIAARAPDLVTLPETGQSSELQRLQELAARLDRVALAQGTTAPPPAASPIVILPPKRRRPPGQAALLLNNRAKVRHALIVSEVLGPPLASRDRPQV